MPKAIFDWGATFFSAVAALLWFLSAAGKVPPMVMYWDAAPPNDPLYLAIKRSARLNKWAAAASGAAAACMAIGGLLPASS